MRKLHKSHTLTLSCTFQCDGGTPRCSNCRDNAATCVYATSRKDRLRTATTHNQDMIALLRDLRTRASGEEQARIDDLLSNVTADVADAASSLQRSPDKSYEAENSEDQGEANISAEVGSSGDLDLVDEDLMRDEQTRATGFIGKASEIQWLRKLHTEGGNDKNDGPYGPPGQDREAAAERLAALRHRQRVNPVPLMHTSKANYYLDEEPLETDFMADPLGMPPFETAEHLMKAFMDGCHSSFPFLAKDVMKELYLYYAALQRGKPYSPPQKWLATINLAFAIGAVYSHLIAAEWRADDRDHLMYYSRACTLGLKDPWWFSHPDLPQMQITGLLSFYYLIIGRVNRAWVLIGLAMRFAYALGLHIRNEDRGSGLAKKETLGRIWWAHFAFERFLSAMIGRPSQGVDRSCSVPFPLPISTDDIDESIIETRFGHRLATLTGLLPRQAPTTGSAVQSPEFSARTDTSVTGFDSANSGTYLTNVVQLCEITQEALHLYGTSTVGQSWQSIQHTIASLNEELEVWAISLPDGLKFFDRRVIMGRQYIREQNTLEILYHNTKILINRPCLCRLDRRILNQTASSNDFNERAAATCVASAKGIAQLLSNDPGRHLASLYESGPWWSMVHNIMQSIVVLLLEISLRGKHFPEDRHEIIPPLKKLIRWLRTMRVTNDVAGRAYPIAFNLLKKMVATIKIDISDLLQEDADLNATETVHGTPSTPILAGSEQSLSANVQTWEQQQSTLQTDPFHFREGDSLFTSHYGGPSLGNFMNYYPDVMEGFVPPSGFPGLFLPSFDEENPLSGFGMDDPMQVPEEEEEQPPTYFGHN
ncbi:hypothetical protein NX059_005536 [Plenodomus lindquistii]|nr:hypothetical protein NX059_005536 [Plenodomus lindquistii]